MRRAIRAYSASPPTPELPEGERVVIDSCSWDGGQLRVAVIVAEGERRGQIAVVHAGELELVLDGTLEDPRHDDAR